MGGGGVGLGGLMDNYFVGFYFIESALQDVFVYKAGAFNYLFLTKKVYFTQVGVITKFSDSMIFKLKK